MAYYIATPEDNDIAIKVLTASGGTVVYLIDPYASDFFSKGRFVYVMTDNKLQNQYLMDWSDETSASSAVSRFYEVKRIFLDRTDPTYNFYISDAQDVYLNNLVDGQLLVYSGGSWTNRYYYALTFDDITDVNITGATNGQTLIYSGGTWINLDIIHTGGNTKDIQFNDNGFLSGVSYFTFDKDLNSFNLGNNNISGQFSSALGYNLTAVGYISHVEGYNNESDANYSHVAGKDNTLTSNATGSTITAISGFTGTEPYVLYTGGLEIVYDKFILRGSDGLRYQISISGGTMTYQDI